MGVTGGRAVCAGIALAATLAAPLSAEICTEVDSRDGWQEVALPQRPIYEFWFDGTWTVDARNFAPVDPRLGHQGADAAALAPFDGYKYDRNVAFGEVLLRINDRNTFTILDLFFLHDPYSNVPLLLLTDDERLYARINDSDDSLADNDGTVWVCAD